MGLRLAVLVTASSVDDGAAAPEPFARLDGQPIGQVRRMYADGKYDNFALNQWVADHTRYEMEIVRRPAGPKGWVRLLIRWTVERISAWMGACRRLTKDREKTVRSLESLARLSLIHLMPNRLRPKGTDPLFQYRMAA